jgi:DNA-binding PadR family transcriptional regulator
MYNILGYTLYQLDKLGKLQKKIIGHMLECTSELENTNHIGKIFGLSQPAIFKSIRLLENENLVQTKQKYVRGRRILTLTDKGAAAALLSGEEKNRIYDYLKRHAPSSFLLLLMNIIKDKNDLNSEWMRLFIEHMLCQEQKLNESDEKKKEELIATLIVGPKNGFVDASKIRRFLERDNILWLIAMLANKIKLTNSIIDRLMSEKPNEAKPKPEVRFWQQISDQFTSKLSDDELKSAIIKSMTNTFYSSADIRKDTSKEMVVDFRAKAFYEGLINMHSDLLRLRVNKADGEVTITPIPKGT